MGILRLCLTGAKRLLKPRTVLKNPFGPAKAIAKVSEKPLFCQEYWAAARANGLVCRSNSTKVSMHEYLNSINHHFVTGANPENMNLIHWQTQKPVRQMISETDREFKALLPTDKKYTVYRAIGEKPDFFTEYKMYQKAQSVKSGDVINMREYAYATSDLNYAKSFLPNGKGILYRLEIPENAKVSRIGDLAKTDEFTFPRSSKWKCTGVSKVQKGDEDYLLIDCRYILPDLF